MVMVSGFFFSSRRRHTRWTGDWSSDVCSSDLIRRCQQTTAKLKRNSGPPPVSYAPTPTSNPPNTPSLSSASSFCASPISAFHGSQIEIDKPGKRPMPDKTGCSLNVPPFLAVGQEELFHGAVLHGNAY